MTVTDNIKEEDYYEGMETRVKCKISDARYKTNKCVRQWISSAFCWSCYVPEILRKTCERIHDFKKKKKMSMAIDDVKVQALWFLKDFMQTKSVINITCFQGRTDKFIKKRKILLE